MTTPYTTGSITLTNGSAVVTGVGTAWQTALIAGGTIYVDASGNSLPILAVNSNTQITAAVKWRGATGTYAYAIMRDTAYGQQTVANAQALADYLQRLDNTALSSLASLVPAADRLPYFSGNAAAALTPLSAFARTLLDDANASAAYGTLGEIPNAQLPNRLKSTSIAASDFNAVAETGWSIGAGSANGNPSGAFGVVMHVQYDASNGAQMYMRPSNGNTYIRGKNAGNLGAWGQVVVTGQQSPTGDFRLKSGVWSVQDDAGVPADIFGSSALVLQKNGTTLQQFMTPDNGQNILRFGTFSDHDAIQFIHSAGTGIFTAFWGAASIFSMNPDATFRSPAVYNATTASAGNVFIATNGTLARSTSSGEYKSHVEDLWAEYADTILQMRPVWYRSLCPMDNPDWSYIGLIAEEVGAIEPRLVHWRTEEIVTDTFEKQVTVSVERPVEREVQVTRAEYVETGLLDDEGKPLFTAVERIETIVETDVVTVEELQTITETEQRAVPLPEPVAEGIMYDRLVVHLIAHAQRQHEKIETLTGQTTDLVARISALEAVIATGSGAQPA